MAVVSFIVGPVWTGLYTELAFSYTAVALTIAFIHQRGMASWPG